MNRPLIICSLFLVVLSSCQNNKKAIQGSWIEKDNFVNPITLDIDDFYLEITLNNHKREKLYHLKDDTFYVNGVDQIYKSIIKIERDKLEIYDIDSTAPVQIFERNTYENIIDYFNSKKNTAIELPQLNTGLDDTGYNYQNTIYADRINGELVMYFNGKLHALNDTSYVVLTKTSLNTKCQLFIDKDIKVGELNTLKTELRKAQLYSIAYATIDNNGVIKNIGTLLPPIDSIGRVPLPPSPPTKNNYKQKDIVIQILPDSIIINEVSVNRKDLKQILMPLVKLNNMTILRVAFNKQLNYATYINHLQEIHNVYRELRNDYSMANFKTNNYLELEYDDLRTVRKLFPRKIHEIDEEEIEKYILQ